MTFDLQVKGHIGNFPPSEKTLNETLMKDQVSGSLRRLHFLPLGLITIKVVGYASSKEVEKLRRKQGR